MEQRRHLTTIEVIEDLHKAGRLVTQMDLAALMGLSQAYISQALNGVRPIAHIGRIKMYMRNEALTAIAARLEGSRRNAEARVGKWQRRIDKANAEKEEGHDTVRADGGISADL